MLWIAGLLGVLGLLLTWVVMLGHAMSAAPKRPGWMTLLGLGLLPAVSLLLGVPVWLHSWSAQLPMGLLVLQGLALVPGVLTLLVLLPHCWWLMRRPSKPTEEKRVFRIGRGAPRLSLTLHRCSAAGDAEHDPVLSNADLVESWARGPGGGDCYAVGLRWNAAARRRLAELDWGGRCAIYLQGQLLVEPVIHGAIGEELEFTGLFTRERAMEIAKGVVG